MRAPIFTIIATAAGLSAAPALLAQGASQSTACQTSLSGDACQKAIDLFRYMNVQLGTLVAGGNATLGQGGALGGLGHVTVEVRANAMRVRLPDVAGASPSVRAGTPQVSTFPVKEQWAAVPIVDAAVGLFKGIPLGITSVGGVDALVSVAYLPEFSSKAVSVKTPDGSIKWGFGARLGIIGETMVTPGVSVTWLRRDLPRATIVSASSTDSLAVRNYDLQTTAWRVVASKKLLILGLAAGIGQDKYSATADASYSLANGLVKGAPIPASVKPTRTNMFVDVSLNFPIVKIVGEVGRVSGGGGDAATFNSFEKPATDPRFYGSLGVRLGI